ncbi:MAG: helix-turn-helix domain-containing protein [Eggerthellaceae bacterium]|nr:helix-turn-helix domain-containing protein [Eggerthellaceae bacterium]
MELKEHLKEHRQRLGLSQEDLAERIFATRQTISSWKASRTYPDVQSLLLLYDLFGLSIDELVKGHGGRRRRRAKSPLQPRPGTRRPSPCA